LRPQRLAPAPHLDDTLPDHYHIMAPNSDAEIKALKERLTKLEGVVKALAESRLDTKVTAMEKTLKALDGTDIVDKAMLTKLMADNQRKQGEEAAKSAKTIVDKAVADAMKAADAVKLDQRLKMLEINFHRLEAQMGALGAAGR
jgi:hypothetical protein